LFGVVRTKPLIVGVRRFVFETTAMAENTNQSRSLWRFIHFVWIPIVGGWFGHAPLKVTLPYAVAMIVFVGVMGGFIGSGWAIFGKWQSNPTRAVVLCALFGVLVFAVGTAGLMALAWALGHTDGGDKGALLGVLGALVWSIVAIGMFKIVFAALKKFLGPTMDASRLPSADDV